jgi:hypothetical protein
VIKYSLNCDNGHGFEAWFKNGEDYETQKKRGFLECPVCGSSNVSKSLMAPSVATSRKREERAVTVSNARQQEIMGKMRELARELKKNSDNVGEKIRRRSTQDPFRRNPIPAPSTDRRHPKRGPNCWKKASNSCRFPTFPRT